MRGLHVIAVDGPGGVGKSTVSRRVAQTLGIAHLDTGAFYRAVTAIVLRAGTDPLDEDAVVAELGGHVIGQSGGRTLLDHKDISDEIRTDPVTALVSLIAAHPAVREKMVAEQRLWVGEAGGRVVVEGRDIGTVVFPDAGLKVYLDAEPEVRARRRFGEMGGAEDSVAAALRVRDHLDSSRKTSPLRPASDAVVIDTTILEVDEVVERILALV